MDLCIASSGIVNGLLVKKGIFFKQTYLLDIQKVASFGWDGVMIEDSKYLKN